jgi:CRP-like cAMP-binding protein
MQLKPFEAGRYNDDSILIRNPENDKQELFKEEEFEIVKFLKENESESLLALLLPNIGVAKKDHIVLCLSVLKKLKSMQIVDYSTITGRKLQSDTGTLELDLGRQKLDLPGARTFAAVCFGVAEKALSWAGPYPLFLLTLGLAAFSFLYFPFQRVENSLEGGGVPYLQLLLTIYLGASAALSFRALLQAAFLKSFGGEGRNPGFSFFFPLVSLDCRKTDVNLFGYKERIQMALLGLLAPLAFSALFTGLLLLGLIGVPVAFFGLSACILATLVLACPFVSADAADILHVLFLRNELNERVSTGLRGIFQTRGSLSREMLAGLIATLVWLIAWLDCLRMFWEAVSEAVSADLFSPKVLTLQLGAGFLIALLLALVMMPVAVFVFGFARDKFGSRKKRIVVRQESVKDSLSFEERMAALEKIPLFAYLNDQERLALLSEMHPAFFGHGEYLMHQGEVGKDFFVLVKGHCNAYFTDIQGRNYLLADLGEGDAFGEIALIDDVPRTASIVSDGGCIVLVLSKEGFDRFALTLGSPDRVKTMIRLTSFFRRHPLFSKLGVKDQAQLIDAFRFDAMTTGEEVPSNEENFYVIYSGKVRMDTGDDSADTSLQADDCFGYSNGLNARYFAVEGTGVLSIKRDEFFFLIWEKLVERPELFI